MFYERKKIIAVACGILALLLSVPLFFTWLMSSNTPLQQKQHAGQLALHSTPRFFSPSIDESLLQSSSTSRQPDVASGVYKASNGNTISSFTPLAADTVFWSSYYPIDFSWSGGTPTSSGSSVTSGIYVPYPGNGFTLTVKSGGSGTLYVYAGVKYALGTISARWSTKGSLTTSTSFDIHSDPFNSADNVRFSLSFQPGFDNLTVTYACTPAAFHTEDAANFLEAAALSWSSCLSLVVSG